MNRKKILNYFEELVSEEDLIFYIGKYICSECGVCKANEFFGMEDIDYLSIATGIAMTNTKKVYVVMEDVYLLKYFNSFIQALVSKCNNLFFILLNSSVYDVGLKQPTIFNTIRSMKGAIFNLGALVHNYDRHFKTKKHLREFKRDYKNLLGPAVGIITVTDNKLFNTANEVEVGLAEFVKYSSKGVTDNPEKKIVSLNLDAIMKEQ